MAKQTQETETRSPGRPASFPDQDTVQFLSRIPVESRDLIRQLAAKREEPLNVTLDAMIRRAFKEMTR